MVCFCQSLFTLDHCIGIIGGRPRHSLYFVGFQGKKAIFSLVQFVVSLQIEVAVISCGLLGHSSLSCECSKAARGE